MKHTQPMKKLLVLLCLSSFLLHCGLQKTWLRSSLMFFNTVCELRVYSSGPEFLRAKRQVQDIFSSIEKLFSPGRSGNRSSQFEYLLKKSLEIHKKTGGCFDITLGILKEAWGFASGCHRIPSEEEIYHLMISLGMDQIQITDNQILIPEKIKLDWGGIAKGYGVDLASQALRDLGIKKGFINAGGDIYCWGTNPNQENWNIGIQHPRKQGYVGVLSITDMGAATSGDYQNFFIKNNTRYHHIFDPSTGYPAKGKQSVTIIGPEVHVCDALSTAVFVSEKTDAILKKFPNYGAIVVNDQGEVFEYGKKYSINWLE
ncbi:MAG: hypothetical protein GF421_02700 [Candidatus Aminicenantes bacterium]|nr:hypothetical protein [Candidatus Aminicenantes bacterium]